MVETVPTLLPLAAFSSTVLLDRSMSVGEKLIGGLMVTSMVSTASAVSLPSVAVAVTVSWKLPV